MRYNLLFLLFYFLFASSIFGQNFPNTGTHGSATTLMTNQGAYSARAYIPMSFLDTTQANLNLYIKNYPGALVRTSSDGIYWKRSIDGKKWEQFGSGGTPTLQQVFDVENADAQFDKNNDIFLNGTRFRINGAATGSFYTEELAEYYHSVDDGNMPQFVFREYPNGTGGAFAEWSSTGGSPVNAREVGIFFQSDSRTDSTTQITIHSGSVPNQAKNGQSATSLRIRPQGIRFFLRNDIPKNFQIVNPSITSDTAWKFMGYNPSDSSVRVFSSNGIVAGVSGWGLTGNSGTLPPSSFIGTTDNKTFRVRTNNNEVARFDSLGARFYLYGGTNPLLSMRQNTTLQEYQFRLGVGSGLSSQAFNLYDASASKVLTRWNGTIVSVGNTNNPYSQSALYVWGNVNGANFDVQADSTAFDDANIEAMDPDYSNGNGIALEYQGRNGTGTTFGYPNRRLGQLRFNADFNLIKVTSNNSLRFGTNNAEKMVLDSNGRVGIGTASPTGLLHVQGADTIPFNGTGITQRARVSIDTIITIGRGENSLDNQAAIEITQNNELILQGNTENQRFLAIKPSPLRGFFSFHDNFANNSNYFMAFISNGAVKQSEIGGRSTGSGDEFYIQTANDARLVLGDSGYGTHMRIADYGSATNGDVLTLVDNTTGEVEWAPGGSGSGTVNTGTANRLAYYPSTGTTVDDASSLFYDNTNGRLGINNTSPAERLDVGGTAQATQFKSFESTNNYSTFNHSSSSGLAAFPRAYFTVGHTSGVTNAALVAAPAAAGATMFMAVSNNSNIGAGGSKQMFLWNDGTEGGIMALTASALNGGAGMPIFFGGSSPTGSDAAMWVTTGSQVGIGLSSTSAKLHIAAGSTSANSAPFKYTSGSLMSSAEAGAKEFLTDKEYLTITTGAARKEITLNDAALTPGTTPVATTNGRLTDGLILASSTYTPTLTNTTNVASSTAYALQYSRVGSTVTVSGKIDVTATTELLQTEVGVSIPVASNFSTNGQGNGGGGILNGTSATNYPLVIISDATNDRISIKFTAPIDSAPVTLTFSFTYTII